MQAMRRKHDLLDKAEHVISDNSVVLVESTECLNFLDLGNHAITKCNERIPVIVGVTRTVCSDDSDLFISHQ